tara:strand:- start:9909 stop:12410 length:2502 start_codon:yes stop_codon:yes gene_type:complete
MHEKIHGKMHEKMPEADNQTMDKETLGDKTLDNETLGELIRVYGTVQGVGFRPFVWRLAHELGLTGEVGNDNEGVFIHLWGTQAQRDALAERLESEIPPLAKISGVVRSPFESGYLSEESAPTDFTIASSQQGKTLTSVATDAATCKQCLTEINDPADRRYGYPFTNCTHCGPRFSIIRVMPYDRTNTSMAGYKMCPACESEYHDPADRRFHAQPNACPVCGPTLWFAESGENALNPSGHSTNLDAIRVAAEKLLNGQIIAIKGIGGFHLACDARNAEAVAILRQRKRRYRKALAIMATDMEMVREYVQCADADEALLTSAAAPVVVLKKKPSADTQPDALPDDIAPMQDKLGFMLPYSPIHHLLMQAVNAPLVMTSGNMSDEPQCLSNDDALQRLSTLADGFLLHDRDIINRIDDSVWLGSELTEGNEELPPQIVRRARGYAPQPIPLPAGFEHHDGILAMGADLKNTFCIVINGQAIMSPHMGDLEDHATQLDYRRQIALFFKLYDFTPKAIVVDKHPNYHSSNTGRAIAAELGIPCHEVQHHHAHIMAAMAEHGIPCDTPPVLGIALDGLGYGDDGYLWGGEFLLCDYSGYKRVARFKPVPLLGGNAAMKEPWRNTLAHLLNTGQWEDLKEQYADTDIIRFLNTKPVSVLQQMMERSVNSPLSSSTGRLFDAVAAALGLCTEQQFHEGEAAMQLEALARQCTTEVIKPYSFELNNVNGLTEVDWSLMWLSILSDLHDHKDPSEIAYRFHLTIAAAIARTLVTLTEQCGINEAYYGGGVLLNRILREHSQQSDFRINSLSAAGLILPVNDSVISLGQILSVAFDRPTQWGG